MTELGAAFDLSGRRALITGGSRGIGLGIAQAMHAAGAAVALVGRDAATLDAAAQQLSANEGGAPVSVYQHDMSDLDGIDALYQRARADGAVDILVNNAGATKRAPAHELSLADWTMVMNLNVTAMFHLCQSFGRDHLAPAAGESGGPRSRGKIVNIASLMSELVRKDNAPYAASKGAVRQLTKALAVDWAAHGINVNAIGPGYIKTDLTRPLWEDAEFDRWVCGRTPVGAWGQPTDIGTAAVFLAAPASDFVTGQTIYVDGGFLASF